MEDNSRIEAGGEEPRKTPAVPAIDGNNSFTITGVKVTDGPALAANNIPAFWAYPHWRESWRHRTLEYHISQVALRYPRTLLRDRERARHQKVVDSKTGKIIGYARWMLPASHVTVQAGGLDLVGEGDAEGGTPAWPEAQIPAVSADEEAEILRVAETAVWDPDEDTPNPALDELREVEKEILTGEKPYLVLDYLVVNTAHQRRGVGTALVRSGLKEAVKLGLDVYVHAMPNGIGLYKRLGFREERRPTKKEGSSGNCLLIYEHHAGVVG
ncbi:hypothetical protein QBC47DRAFT_96605 [Echria macrotheca]|uniref:N-acetyltransferase domain-containing protein n=1 Tax=Echria macrotheca TaxID=438768 RepID=A0AAJ0BIK1_9PEZI|nr:hypothetical protein QBC47DRAFT_96605 [Echria macrotheca]